MARKGILKRCLEALAEIEADLAARWTSSAHQRLLAAQWLLAPRPEHFDHHIDLHHQWLKSRNSMWLERGVISSIALKGGDVLELCCGDGFNARNFYSLRSRRVIGCDLDTDAIATARRKNAAANVEYRVADLRHSMPEGRFDNVIWDFGFTLLDYFSVEELEVIFRQIRQRLGGDGILSGYTLAADAAAQGPALRGIGDLHTLLAPHFEHVTVFESFTPGRHNLYFWASDLAVPFSPGWGHAVHS
jgi:SAM-dependent methyltransferase